MIETTKWKLWSVVAIPNHLRKTSDVLLNLKGEIENIMPAILLQAMVCLRPNILLGYYSVIFIRLLFIVIMTMNPQLLPSEEKSIAFDNSWHIEEDEKVIHCRARKYESVKK